MTPAAWSVVLAQVTTAATFLALLLIDKIIGYTPLVVGLVGGSVPVLLGHVDAANEGYLAVNYKGLLVVTAGLVRVNSHSLGLVPAGKHTRRILLERA